MSGQLAIQSCCGFRLYVDMQKVMQGALEPHWDDQTIIIRQTVCGGRQPFKNSVQGVNHINEFILREYN